MLTQLSTVKSRLAIDSFDLQYDDILTNAITAVSFRFDKETNRTLARTVNFTQEFEADDTEIGLSCYPFESLTRFELKSTEAEGWITQTGTDFLIRRACILSLSQPFSIQPLALSLSPVARSPSPAISKSRTPPAAWF